MKSRAWVKSSPVGGEIMYPGREPLVKEVSATHGPHRHPLFATHPAG
jgi:hypothetical protein